MRNERECQSLFIFRTQKWKCRLIWLVRNYYIFLIDDFKCFFFCFNFQFNFELKSLFLSKFVLCVRKRCTIMEYPQVVASTIPHLRETILLSVRYIDWVRHCLRLMRCGRKKQITDETEWPSHREHFHYFPQSSRHIQLFSKINWRLLHGAHFYAWMQFFVKLRHKCVTIQAGWSDSDINDLPQQRMHSGRKTKLLIKRCGVDQVFNNCFWLALFSPDIFFSLPCFGMGSRGREKQQNNMEKHERDILHICTCCVCVLYTFEIFFFLLCEEKKNVWTNYVSSETNENCFSRVALRLERLSTGNSIVHWMWWENLCVPKAAIKVAFESKRIRK